jgi:YfiH family protein
VGDDGDAVTENRGRIAIALGFREDDLVLARQVHGRDVLVAGEHDSGVIGEADVLVSRTPGKIIGILTADCVPVVMLGTGAIAIAHAGWRGLVSGSIEAAIEMIGPVERAWVGPSIHACCYEVGPEVVEAFRSSGLPVAGDDHVDPGRAAVVALHRAGITDVSATDVCTSCDPRYFSYRRDGVTGRQGAFAGLLRA